MGVREELEEMGVDAGEILKIVYGPEARRTLQQLTGCDRAQADLILDELKEQA